MTFSVSLVSLIKKWTKISFLELYLKYQWPSAAQFFFTRLQHIDATSNSEPEMSIAELWACIRLLYINNRRNERWTLPSHILFSTPSAFAVFFFFWKGRKISKIFCVSCFLKVHPSTMTVDAGRRLLFLGVILWLGHQDCRALLPPTTDQHVQIGKKISILSL